MIPLAMPVPFWYTQGMDEDKEPLSSQEVDDAVLWILEAIEALEAQDPAYTDWAIKSLESLVDWLLDRNDFLKKKPRRKPRR
jgi:hypothetical protein